MSAKAVRIAAWSGPRSLSTALMRSFGNRLDVAVIDEPFYGVYLKRTKIDHPLRRETLARMSADPATVIETLLGSVPDGRAIFYQKHMAHHMLEGIDLEWMARCKSFFLIRSPERVLSSYSRTRWPIAAADIGFARQAELFEREAERLGRAPPVIEAEDLLADPEGVLRALCAGLEIRFDEAMLSWPPGARLTDGPWAPAWYDQVERSTGFSPPSPPPPALRADLARLAEETRPAFERLRRLKILATR
ncbi:MAG: hypothetical protein ACRED9_05450 [Caulobacteraceae bacterium]